MRSLMSCLQVDLVGTLYVDGKDFAEVSGVIASDEVALEIETRVYLALAAACDEHELCVQLMDAL